MKKSVRIILLLLAVGAIAWVASPQFAGAARLGKGQGRRGQAGCAMQGQGGQAQDGCGVQAGRGRGMGRGQDMGRGQSCGMMGQGHMMGRNERCSDQSDCGNVQKVGRCSLNQGGDTYGRQQGQVLGRRMGRQAGLNAGKGKGRLMAMRPGRRARRMNMTPAAMECQNSGSTAIQPKRIDECCGVAGECAEGKRAVNTGATASAQATQTPASVPGHQPGMGMGPGRGMGMGMGLGRAKEVRVTPAPAEPAAVKR